MKSITRGSPNSFSAGISNKLPHCFLFVFLLFSAQCGRLNLADLQPHTPSDWPLYGGDPGRTHAKPIAVSPPFELVWEKKITAAIGQTILHQDGMIFIPTLNGKIDILRLESGKTVGKFKLSRSTIGAIALHGSQAIVVRRNEKPAIQAIDMKTGDEIWKATGETLLTEPLIAGEDLVVAYYSGSLVCYDLASGELKWQTSLNTQTESSPAFSAGLVIVGGDDGRVTAWRGKNLVWEYQTQGAIKASPTCLNDRVFIGSTDEHFYCLDLLNGQLLWSFSADGKIFLGAAADGEKVCFGTTQHTIYCLEGLKGNLLWRTPTSGVISTAPVITPAAVIFGSLDDHLYAVDPQTGGHLWSYKTRGHILTHPIVVDNGLVAASEPENIYFFKNR